MSFWQRGDKGDTPKSPAPLDGSAIPSSGPGEVFLHHPPSGPEVSSGDRSTSESPAERPPSGSVKAATPSTEDLLFEAMDRAAHRFIEMLDSDEKDDEGEDKISIEMRFKLFEKGQDWLVRRQKLRPQKVETEGQGVRDMREWISNPDAMAQLDEAIFARGFVKVPEKKTGRPRKEDMPIRERFKTFKDGATAEQSAKDDSGWQGLLKQPSTGEEEAA